MESNANLAKYKADHLKFKGRSLLCFLHLALQILLGQVINLSPSWVCVRSEACCEVCDGRKATWCFCIVGQCQEEKNLSY